MITLMSLPSCFLASIAASVTLFCSMPSSVNEVEKLRDLLSQRQLASLDAIARERATISLEGFVCGLIVAAVMLLVLNRWCYAAFALFFVQGLYYHLRPKSKWLLNELNTRKQIDQWLEVYKSYKTNGVRAGALAALTYFIIGFVACNTFTTVGVRGG